jgi:hypothetical protein
MPIPTNRCRCSTERTKETVRANQKILAKRIVLIDHEVDRVGVAVVAGERRMIVHPRVVQRVEPRGRVAMSRVSNDLSRSWKTSSPTRS